MKLKEPMGNIFNLLRQWVVLNIKSCRKLLKFEDFCSASAFQEALEVSESGLLKSMY